MVTSDLQLIEAGGGSLPEMRKFLPAEDVAFALVRMGFGAGRFRRNHFLFVHWAGDACPHVRRGKANAKKPAIKQTLQAGEALEHFAGTLEDVELIDVIAKLSKVLVIDGETSRLSTADPTQGITLESFEQALAEDAHCKRPASA